LASLISITNSILKAYCCIAPPNYAISKKLDTPGSIMTALMLIVIAVSVGMLIAGSV
jgi:hypothetical protein